MTDEKCEVKCEEGGSFAWKRWLPLWPRGGAASCRRATSGNSRLVEHMCFNCFSISPEDYGHED